LRAAATASWTAVVSAQHPILQHLTVLGFDALLSRFRTSQFIASFVYCVCVCLVGKVHGHCLCLVTTQPCLLICFYGLPWLGACEPCWVVVLMVLAPAQRQTRLAAGSVSSSSVLCAFSHAAQCLAWTASIQHNSSIQLNMLWQTACISTAWHLQRHGGNIFKRLHPFTLLSTADAYSSCCTSMLHACSQSTVTKARATKPRQLPTTSCMCSQASWAADSPT
jgi:hypothetical protein